jgi:hypothetical protein
MRLCSTRRPLRLGGGHRQAVPGLTERALGKRKDLWAQYMGELRELHLGTAQGPSTGPSLTRQSAAV